MAVVRGVKERVHLPIYDAITVDPEQQLREVVKSGNQLRFFVDVQHKTKLQTNLQSASLLPHYNTFEARALRVVISDLPPLFVDPSQNGDSRNGSDANRDTGESERVSVVIRDDDGDWDIRLNGDAVVLEDDAGYDAADDIEAAVTATLPRLLEALEEAKESEGGEASFEVMDDEVTIYTADSTNEISDDAYDNIDNEYGSVILTERQILGTIRDLPERIQPLAEQLNRRNGSGTVIGKFVYSTVTTLYVGEKVMIQMPTWFFPAGAGPYSESVDLTTHGEPSPMATFRFAEPIFIDKQQNFRVEIEIPDPDTAEEIKRLYGPFHIWVVLDGYMTRDVQ